MKLLSWMRAIKQNPSREFKGISGSLCLRGQGSTEVRTNSFSFSFSRPSHDLKTPRVEEELRFDEDGFCGFLAIGMLGTDPETPKFAKENVNGDIAKLISEKLDKFLEEVPEVERWNAQGDRVLQSHQLSEPSVERGVKGLLKSLFKMEAGGYSVEKHATKDLIKRIFKKLHGSSTKTRSDDDDNAAMAKKKDLKKNVQIFPSKVHPVLSTPARYDYKRRSCDLKVPNLTGGSSSNHRKRESWIKTDAEYLVLEL